MNALRVLDLFSGIGGFSLGLERAGMRTVAFCELDPYCQAVLKKHWPDVPCFDDIRAVDASRLAGLGRIDLVCGGFPCQPFSVAGKQKAYADDRHLWPQMLRVIALARPAWVIGENVAGLIPLALDDVLFDLEGLGYATRTFVIPACALGAHHRRDRVWIIGCDTNRDSESVSAVHAEMEKLCSAVADSNSLGIRGAGHGETTGAARESCGEAWQQRIRTDPGSSGEAMADTSRSGLALGELLGELPVGAGLADTRENVALERDGQHASNYSADSARAGRSESAWDWRTEPNVGRVAHGVPRRVDRLRALGNAVVPQIPEIIGRAIMRAA